MCPSTIFYLPLLHVTVINHQRASDFYVLLIIKTESSKQGKTQIYRSPQFVLSEACSAMFIKVVHASSI
jgi:hypothetical protein